MALSLDCWVVGGEVAGRYSESLHAQISSDGPYVIMFQDDLPPLPFPQDICHAMHSEASAPSENVEQY